MKKQRVSNAFVAASWVALGAGMIGFIVGLARAEMQLNEKGYYFTILLYGLFAVVSLQKAVRDRLENIQVTDIYYGICWFATLSSIVLLAIGLWNATILPSEKGFYAFAFLLALFGAIAVQKIRGTICFRNNIKAIHHWRVFILTFNSVIHKKIISRPGKIKTKASLFSEAFYCKFIRILLIKMIRMLGFDVIHRSQYFVF